MDSFTEAWINDAGMRMAESTHEAAAAMNPSVETSDNMDSPFNNDSFDALKAERDELLASLGEIYEQVDYWAGEDTVYDDDYPLRKVFERVAALSAKAGIPIFEKKLLECDDDDREEYEYLLNLAKKRAGISTRDDS